MYTEPTVPYTVIAIIVAIMAITVLVRDFKN